MQTRVGAPPDQSDRFVSRAQVSVEYCARRAMWILVAVVCLWDIAVTFGEHLGWTPQLLYASLMR